MGTVDGDERAYLAYNLAMERDPQDHDRYGEDPLGDEPLDQDRDDDRHVDRERREGASEDYKPGLHSDDEDVDYETRTHGDNRRI